MTLRSPRALVEAGLARAGDLPGLERVAARYAVAITPDLSAIIDRADPADPIGLQYLPDPAELEARPEELSDPIGDEAHSPVAGIVHRYPDRVLLKPVSVCAVYCRFCFRRESVGRAQALSAGEIRATLDYIRQHPAIWEVILSGGDPLVLSPRRLTRLTQDLAAIGHVKVVRIHTRLPVADPSRVTPALVRALRAEGAATWLVLHVNHPRELTEAATEACARLVDAGIPVLSQTVLLRGVNDTPAVLEALMRALVERRIKPYYLHHGDLAPGTARFRTGIEDGLDLAAGLRGHVSGLCQPTYVLDIPGGHGKARLGPTDLLKEGDGWSVRDRAGRRHRYLG